MDILRLGCTLPKLANICLHKSNIAKFYPLLQSDKDLSEKKREDMVGDPSITIKGKAVVGDTLHRVSTDWCKTIVRIDAS